MSPNALNALAVPRMLILASSSPYRRELLERLRIPFSIVVPAVDESPAVAERPVALARRLAEQKASRVAASAPDAYVIGSDQVLSIAGRALGKPGDFATAAAQLRAASGQTVVFHTALCVIAPDGRRRTRVVDVEVRFRTLSDASIARYLEAERPFDCAGAFKSERLGIALVRAIRSDDPTALIGLPLITLVEILFELGWDVLDSLPAGAD